MRKIVVIAALFMFVFSAYAGETQQDKRLETKNQIVLAFSDARSCRASCRNLFDICKSHCVGYSNVDFCVGGCADSYDWCLENCDKADYGK